MHNPLVIIISGASRGIGSAIAEAFASDGQGHTLILVSKNEGRLAAYSKQLQSRYPRSTVAHYACDMAERKQIEALSSWLKAHHPRIDILVNNAGTFLPGSVHNEPEGTLEAMLSTNLLSAYHLTRSLLPAMMTAGNGHIFNMCSIAALQAYDNGGSYSISKWALLGFGKNLREEMKPHGIKVTNILPGAVYTDSWASSGIDPQRIMEAGDIARLVYTMSFLSPQACVEDVVIRPQLGDL